MRISEASILILPGRGDSPPDHWQSRWQKKIATATRVHQHDWENPQKEKWLAQIHSAVVAQPRPVVLVAHSLGCIAAVWAAHGHLAAGQVAGAFLVAPPSDEMRMETPQIDRAFSPVPRHKLPFPCVLVASRNDPRADFAWSEAFASAIGAQFVDAGEAGHINVDSGFGPWPEGLMRLGTFMRTLGGKETA
ncbi:MAG: alpha/beta fold hydrolase [Hyphomicrobiales bacterium]|nr:alpha/beta fold hydrolase [Hyphomicrobiales bacterium]MDE2113623.1 alpha/beta hydrolase [Hyphomicrobiales bacterium]